MMRLREGVPVHLPRAGVAYHGAAGDGGGSHRASRDAVAEYSQALHRAGD